MVSIHAHNRFTVTPHRTADNLLVAPTPMIDPVMVWVVLTGIFKFSVTNNVMAPAVSAATPSKGVTFVILVPMVLMILQPPLIVPNAMAVSMAEGREYRFVVYERHQWVSAITSLSRKRL